MELAYWINGFFSTVFFVMIGAVLAMSRVLSEKDGSYRGLTCGKLSRREWLWFLGLMLAALALRIFGFGEIPGGMNQDGAMAAVDAKALAEYGTDRYGMHMPVHFTAWGYGQMSVLLSYCMVPFIKLFGMSAVTARLPILLASMAGLAALFFLARRLLGSGAAVMVLALGVWNPWHFMQSRWALDCNLFPHMFLLGLLFLLAGLQKRRALLYLSMVFFALCMYSYGISFYTVPVFLLVMCCYLLWKRILKWWEALLSAVVYFLISWPICLTMMINAFGWETIETPFFTMPYFPYSMRSHDILFFCEDKLTQLISNLQCLIRVYTQGDSLPWNTIAGFGVLNACFVPFVFLGLYYCIRLFIREQEPVRKAGFLSLLVFFGIGNLAGILTSQANVNRVNILMYSLILLAGFGMYFTYRCSRKLACVILPVYLALGVLFVHTYFTVHAQVLEGSFFKGFLEAVTFVGQESDCERFVITPDSQYRGSRNVSEILTLFALDVDAQYYQGRYPDENGLYFSDKYRFENASGTQPDPNAPVAYVIAREEAYLFDGSGYILVPFEGYYAVIPSPHH